MDIAIIGMGCRFPRAPNPSDFWELVRNGVVAFQPIPSSRWNHSSFFDPSLRAPDKAYVDRGAYLEDEELREFAALHFGIAPRRLQVTDPQHRLLLDTVRCALQDAGYENRSYPRERTGVFVGASVSEYKDLQLSRLRVLQLFDGAFGRRPQSDASRSSEAALVEDVAPLRAFSLPGNLLNMAAATVAQTYDLGGPAFSLDAACSSALVAVHNAVVHLRAGEIDFALGGGVYLNLMPDNLVSFSRIGAISRAGACRPFDSSADGFLMGEGVGMVVLKRREDAERDGDRIYALIRGSGCNNDGRSEGPMTPRQGGQLAALRLAYRDARIAPHTVGYVEAHGTATTVGDVVEVGALRSLFEESGWSPRYGAQTALGSIKANIGHTMSAAGIAGLIKAALSLEHRTLPPQPSVIQQNPKLGLVEQGSQLGPFFLPSSAQEWEEPAAHPRRAAVSSFGFGGTNAHLVLEEASPRGRRAAPQKRAPTQELRRAEVLVLSAGTPALLGKHASAVLACLPALERDGARLCDLAFALATGRSHSDCRVAIVAESFSQFSERLDLAAKAIPQRPLDEAPRIDSLAPGVLFVNRVLEPDARRVALLFPGQGAQQVGLLREAYEQLPAFRKCLDALDDALAPELHQALGGTLRSFLYPLLPLGEGGRPQSAALEEARRRLTATEVCQPAMAAVELSLHALLQQMGVQPAVVIGHSLGEFVAAAAANVLSPESCIQLVARRGLAMASLPLSDPGAMASVDSSRSEVSASLKQLEARYRADGSEPVVVANVNHPEQTVISGSTSGVGVASALLAARGRKVTRLEVSHAFHSPLMQGLTPGITDLLEKIPLRAPVLPVVSAISGGLYPEGSDAPERIRALWIRHAAAPIDFVSAVRCAAAPTPSGAQARLFIQVGAGNSLLAFVKASLAEQTGTSRATVASREEDGLASLATAVGLIWAAGNPIDFGPLFEGRDARQLTLPPTPLETQQYWVVEKSRKQAEPLALVLECAREQPGFADLAKGGNGDPLVALFREQVALLQAQAKILDQRGLATGLSPAAIAESLPIGVPTSTASSPSNADLAAAATRDEVWSRVQKAVARISAFPSDAVKPGQTLAGDLGFDSLMTAELDAELAGAFPKAGHLPRELLGAGTTVADLVRHCTQGSGPGSESRDRVSQSSGSADAPLLFFRLSPVEAPLPVQSPPEAIPGALLLTRDDRGVAEALVRRLAKGGRRAVVVDLDRPFSGIAPMPGLETHAFECGAGGSDANTLLQQASSAIGRVGGVVHLAPLSRSPGAREEGLASMLASEVWPTLLWAHRLARAQAQPDAPIDGGLFLAATGAGGDIGGNSWTCQPDVLWQSAALSGFVKALSRERSEERVKRVDLFPDDGAESMADSLLAELGCADVSSEVGWRAGVRRKVEFLPSPSGQSMAVTSSDVVLVTGGGRGVGARLAITLAQARCSLILVGRTAMDSEVEATLRSVRAHGARATYVRWDVSEVAPAELKTAREELGAVTALLHAAGTSEDGPIAGKDESSLIRVMSPKLAGLAHLLAATEGDPVRLAILISSWSAHFGNAGQADYSAANAALAAVASVLPRLKPGLRAISLAYPPWNGTRMVARIPAVVREALIEQGVPFIDDSTGTRALLDALEGGLDGDILLAPSAPPRERVERIEVTLDRRNDVYLEDHQLAGQPVLPLACAIDLMTEVAARVFGPDDRVCLRNLQLRQPVRVADAIRLTLTARRRLGAGAEASVALCVAPVGGRLSFSRSPSYVAQATVAVEADRHAVSPRSNLPGAPLDSLPLSLGEFYGSTTFHGPRLQGIQSIEALSADGIAGWVRTSRPSDWSLAPRRNQWIVDPLAVDGAFQLAAYWAWVTLGRAGFPISVEQYNQWEPFPEGLLRASLTLEQANGERIRGSILLEDPKGRLIASAIGVEGEFKHRDPRFLRGRVGAQAAPQRPLPPIIPPQAPAVAAEESAPIPAASASVEPSSYRIEQFPEVQELEERLQMAEGFGLKNPYFNVHERVTNDTSVVAGRTMINWSSYNYLGLSGDPQVNRAAQEAIARYGTSVSASRVASGEKPLHRELERELASFLGTEDSLVMVSGHGAFVTVIGHLLGPTDLILHDALAHDCIMAGAKLSGAKRRPFPHNDWEALDRTLSQLRSHYRRVLIAIEGVYSMDGDIADLPRFIEIKKKHRSLLLVDEAHSIGVLGETGKGIGEHFGVDRADVELWMGTLSKSFASCGGYVGGSKALVQYLKYTAGGFVYSVGISPANAASAAEALHQLKQHPQKVRALQQNARLFLKIARERGIDTGYSNGSAVVPAIIGNSLHSLQIAEGLRQRGINVQPILYPAVEEAAARLRFFVTATHSEQQIRETISALEEEIAKARSEGELHTGSL